MTLYDRVAATPDGARALAQARLRHETLHLLWDAQAASGMSVEQLAKALGVRRRTVRRAFDGDGNLPVGTLARYLHAMGYEVELRVVAAGEPRRKMIDGKAS
jgi:DNA-binding phage protein